MGNPSEPQCVSAGQRSTLWTWFLSLQVPWIQHQPSALLARPSGWPLPCIWERKGKGAGWWLHYSKGDAAVLCKSWAYRCQAGWSAMGWPSACLESSLQWGQCGWSKSRLRQQKSTAHTRWTRLEFQQCNLQHPVMEVHHPHLFHKEIAREREFIQLEKAEPKYELWSPRNQSPGLLTLIHCLLQSRK